MTTETTTATITTPTSTLRAILAALDEYTHPDKHRHVLTLAHITPVIVEQTANVDAPPTTLRWEATNSTELLQLTCSAEHTLTTPAFIDPAQLLAALPKKTEARYAGPITLTVAGATWQLTTSSSTSTGTTLDAGSTWPTTPTLWNDQHPNTAPHNIGAPMLTRLTKLAKHLDADTLRLASMAHTDGQPDPHRPLVYTITTAMVEARVLIMPRR
jgi:hypothetical protein